MDIRSRAIHATIKVWTQRAYRRLDRMISVYQGRQEALASTYRIEAIKPRGYSEDLRKRIISLAADAPHQTAFAWTSGTTSKPKQILFNESRSRLLQRKIVEQVLLAYDYLKMRRPAFYLLTSMAPDRSFSSLFSRKPLPRLISDHILADSVVHVPEASNMVGRYSQEALHAALIILSQPALILSANPSSLFHITDDLNRSWPARRGELEEILNEEWVNEFLARWRFSATSRLGTLRRIVRSETPPSQADLFRRLETIVCWQSGYLETYLERLRRQLSTLNVHFFPMFSMSTETVAYLTYPRISADGGLPIFPGVCYEFLPSAEANSAADLIKPWNLTVGETYNLVVSDAYGLQRYRTDDIFDCIDFHQRVPVLRFKHRAGLYYSFTGEKITDLQLLELYSILKETHELNGVAMTCFPSRSTDTRPNYVLVASPPGDRKHPLNLDAEEVDRVLMQLNEEYSLKRKSGRLGPLSIVYEEQRRIEQAIRSFSREMSHSSPSQFKLLPLYQMGWEELRFD